ncbi:MAG: branched-chain-amino-acid transaminase [bacterium]
MGLQIYVNGHYYDEEEAKISVFDHGFLYGDGVFEGIRAYNGRVFRLKEHIVRLYRSAKSIALDISMSMEEMEAALLETLRRNELKNAYIRLVVSRGKGDLGLDPRKCSRPTVVIIAHRITLYPEETYQDGLEVRTLCTRRSLAEALNPAIKSLNYLNNILAKIEVINAGLLEGIMLNNQGYIAEATGDNVFIYKDNMLLTPPPSAGILEGVTRGAVMELAQEMGLDVREELFTQHDIYIAEEAFLTGTAAEIIPVVKVDGRSIGNGCPGSITTKLISRYRTLANSTGSEIYI